MNTSDFDIYNCSLLQARCPSNWFALLQRPVTKLATTQTQAPESWVTSAWFSKSPNQDDTPVVSPLQALA